MSATPGPGPDSRPVTSPAPDPGGDDDVRLTAHVAGRVQGVGFRWWTRARALELGLRGSATNLADGRVQVVAEGPRRALDALLELLRSPGAPGRVTFVGDRWSPSRGLGDGVAER